VAFQFCDKYHRHIEFSGLKIQQKTLNSVVSKGKAHNELNNSWYILKTHRSGLLFSETVKN